MLPCDSCNPVMKLSEMEDQGCLGQAEVEGDQQGVGRNSCFVHTWCRR